jgi:7,8-dihydropterin-6-yl-methyl-4-(beta-D-ribofuranosyl)aminobenzene 5'-phosphate synthase
VHESGPTALVERAGRPTGSMEPMDATGPLRSRPLDELVLTVLVDNETDTLSSVSAGVPQQAEMLGHLGRATPAHTVDDHSCFQVFDHLCVACHGFSVLARGRIGDETHTALFDAGPYGDVWLANVERLGVDLAAIETVFLSHWHWDHSGALPAAVAAIAAARQRAGLEAPVLVDLHPDRPDQRGVEAVPGTFVTLPPEPTFDAFTEAGGHVVTEREPHLVADGFFLASGAIERLTAYETGLVGHHSFHGGVATPDPLIMDERFLAADVAGRGVTVLSACSHAGIVNACLGAQAHYPDRAMDLVLGGYHLAGAGMEDRIAATVRDLAGRIDPAVVAPGHCTGWRAKAALATRFAPDRYGPSVVGSTYVLAPPA